MNAALPRFLKSAYRREPLASFLITIGLVNGAIGGLDGRWELFSFGLGTVGVAIALRWVLMKQTPKQPQPIKQRYLPPSSSSPALPNLIDSKKNISK